MDTEIDQYLGHICEITEVQANITWHQTSLTFQIRICQQRHRGDRVSGEQEGHSGQKKFRLKKFSMLCVVPHLFPPTRHQNSMLSWMKLYSQNRIFSFRDASALFFIRFLGAVVRGSTTFSWKNSKSFIKNYSKNWDIYINVTYDKFSTFPHLSTTRIGLIDERRRLIMTYVSPNLGEGAFRGGGSVFVGLKESSTIRSGRR